MYKCPKCGASDTSKERLKGWDTGDRICANCGCTTAAVDFRKAAALTSRKFRNNNSHQYAAEGRRTPLCSALKGF